MNVRRRAGIGATRETFCYIYDLRAFMWDFTERAAEELYREARLNPDQAVGAAEVAAGLLGPDCITLVPGSALPGRAELARVEGRWRIYLRRGASPEDMHHAIGHELGHLWVRRNMPGNADEEEIADRIGAALCAPRCAYLRAHEQHGWMPRRLGRMFVLRPGSAALRISECTGAPVALVTPRRVRIRGESWPWPEEPSLRLVAHGEPLPIPGVRPISLGRGRILLRVVA